LINWLLNNYVNLLIYNQKRGSQHNDLFIPNELKAEKNEFSKSAALLSSYSDPLSISKIELKTSSNNAGGTLGGITTGEIVFFRVAIKPVSTIGKNQNTFDFNKTKQTLQAKGRHDPCVLPRAIPIIEAMAAIVSGDHCLLQAARKLSVDCLLGNLNNNQNSIDQEQGEKDNDNDF